MNSSSVPTKATMSRSASRAVCRWRIWRGDATTSLPSSQTRSAYRNAVPSCQGSSRSVEKSGCMTKSP